MLEGDAHIRSQNRLLAVQVDLDAEGGSGVCLLDGVAFTIDQTSRGAPDETVAGTHGGVFALRSHIDPGLRLINIHLVEIRGDDLCGGSYLLELSMINPRDLIAQTLELAETGSMKKII